MRISAAQFRELKKCPDAYRRCAKKASDDEMSRIKKVLDLLLLEGNDKDVEVEVVPQVAASSGKEQKLPEVASVFSKVLQKKSSEPESPQLARGKAAPTSLVLVPASSSAVPASSSATPKGERPVLKRHMAQLQLEEDEEKELLAWMSQKVPEVQKKRRNKQKQKTGGRTKAGVGKKPAISPNKDKLKKHHSFKPQSFGQHKCSFKHRKTSTADHSAQKQALRQGVAKEEAKEAGKKAMQEMAHKKDSGELKPPPGQK